MLCVLLHPAIDTTRLGTIRGTWNLTKTLVQKGDTMRTVIKVAAWFIIFMIAGNQTYAADGYPLSQEEQEESQDDPSMVVNRPVNVQGLTGLIMTTSAYTQPKGRVVAGLATIAENSHHPDFSVVQGIATITAGIADRVEFGVRGHVIGTNLGSSSTREVGAGDTDLLLKWRASSSGDLLPAIAFGLAFTLPTGDSAKGLRGVEHEGARIMVIGTSESEMPGDYFIGMYLEGQIVSNDWTTRGDANSRADRYGVFNAGVLFPLVENRRLQAIVEYNAIVRKDIPTVYEENHKSVMPGLRYVTKDFNISLGVQFYHRDAAGATNDLRYVGTISCAF
jgi:hypothetical protein